MAYNRGYNVGGGGYPPVAPNPGGMYNQPMPPSHQHPQQYGQPFNRNAGVWNMPPGPHIPPQGQQMSPWINNNIPTSFRGYGNVHDNRNQNMNMGLKPNLRMGQGNKRPMDWNNSPNKRNRIGGNINNSNQLNQNQKNKPNNNLNPSNTNTPQQKKPWIPYNKNNRVNNNNNNNNFNNNKRRNQNNREVKINDKDKNQTNQKKEIPVENIKLDSNSEQSILDATQEKYFKEASGLICNLCDVFLQDKACAAEHSKLETHQTKFNEAKELEEKEKAAAEAVAAAAAASSAAETETPTESSSDAKDVTATDNENVSKPEIVENSEASDAAEQNGSSAEPLPVVEKETAEGDINAETLAEVSSATVTATEGDNATISESVEETTPQAEAVDTGDAELAQRGGGRGGRGNRGRGGRGRNRGRGRR